MATPSFPLALKVATFFSFAFVLSGLLVISHVARAQGRVLYDSSRIQVIEITFRQSNWDYMMDTAMAGKESYILASQVKINGQSFDSVGVKYKGNSSYNANRAKNPLHLELNHVISGQNYDGYRDIKLSNGFLDPAFVREAVAYEHLRQYMHASKANFARVYINGSYYGLFTNVEHVGKRFVSQKFNVSSKPFFKCTPVGGAGPNTTNLPTLQWRGADSTLASYKLGYEIESTGGWKQLLNLIDTLNNQPSHIEKVLNVDRALWMLAINNAWVNLDSYSGTFAQNYYLAVDQTGRFSPIMWDLNMCYGGFSSTGLGNLNTTQKVQMDPLLHANWANRPLINKLLSIPTYRKQYLSHLRTIMDECIATGNYVTRARQMQALIDSSLRADNNKFYTITQTNNNITTSVGPGPGGGGTPGLSELMGARLTWLRSNATYSAAAPTLASPTWLPANPTYQSSATVQLRATNAQAVWMLYRASEAEPFRTLQLYDDGQHQDYLAGDGIYGNQLMMNFLKLDYYFYAESAANGTHLPARAAHVFYTMVPQARSVTPGQVVVNEFLALNNTDTVPASGAREDWIELHNTTTDTLDLSGLYLSDSKTSLQKSQLPAGTRILPNGYLLLWADDATGSANEIHLAFKLSGGGESIVLSDQQGIIIDSLSFGQQQTDVSMSRCGTSGGGWAMGPSTRNTPNRANACTTTSLDRTSVATMRLWPNPTTGLLHLTMDAATITSITVLNSLGQSALVNPALETSDQVATLDLTSLPKGCYYVVANSTAGTVRQLVVVK